LPTFGSNYSFGLFVKDIAAGQRGTVGVNNAFAEEIKMSRIGKMPVIIPSGVTVTQEPGNIVRVKNSKGELTEKIPPEIEIDIKEAEVLVKRSSDAKRDRAMHGLSRALIANMVAGLTEGFSKTLEIVGVGYKVQKSGNKIVLNVGYSHPVEVHEQKSISLDVEGTNIIKVSGISKQAVGEIAAEIRGIRPPEPYKGKGIRYKGETVLRKVGKTGM
jgi:large subunit ribosomal protein L6